MGERILFMDDSPERRRAATTHLLARTCGTATEAIELVLEESWDAIYLDHDLGGEQDEPVCAGPDGMTGMHVVDALVLRGPRSEHVVVHSVNGPAAAEMYRRLRDAGFDVDLVPFTRLLQTWRDSALTFARAPQPEGAPHGD